MNWQPVNKFNPEPTCGLILFYEPKPHFRQMIALDCWNYLLSIGYTMDDTTRPQISILTSDDEITILSHINDFFGI